MNDKSSFKGITGEDKTKLFHLTLNPKHHRKHDNVLIKTDLDSTQIDHVIVSRYGIFVVETKNWSGDSVIYGSSKDKTWTVFIKKSKHYYPNPIRQNYKHRVMLSNFLEIPLDKTISIIPIWGGCNFKNGTPEGVICESNALFNGISYIKEIVNNTDIVFSDDQVFKINETLMKLQKATKFADHYHHAQHIKHKQGEKSVKTEMSKQPRTSQQRASNICPRCKIGKLVEHKATKPGVKFFGCNKYPTCRYTKFKKIARSSKLNTIRKCEDCGNDVKDEFSFCPFCGAEFE